MTLKTVLFGVLFAVSAFGDVFMGELGKGTCTRIKGQTYASYSKSVLSSRKYEVTLDDESKCGRAIYVLKKEGRKRWAVFAAEEGCKCYLSFSQQLDSQKGQFQK